MFNGIGQIVKCWMAVDLVVGRIEQAASLVWV